MNLQMMVQEAVQDSDDWFGLGNKGHIAYHALALCGEAGELANLVKKVERGTNDFVNLEEDMKSELTDVFIYVLVLAGLLGVDLEEAYRIKRHINEKRFGTKEK